LLRLARTLYVVNVLSQDRIVDATIELVEREGVEALSMRRIAAELGAGAMSLYNHVSSKAALLDAVGARLLGGIELADADPSADWTERAKSLARALRTVSLRHPRCTMLLVTRELNDPAALRPIEQALALLRGAGFEDEVAVRVTRMFIAYTIGAVLREVGVAPTANQPPLRGLPEAELMDPQRFPNITELAKPLSEFDHEAEFEFGLELLVRAAAPLATDQPTERH
jgi:AcrR family transcriptional regulator